MCRYAFHNYKQHYACFDCRKMFRQARRTPLLPRSAQENIPCPQCAAPMKNMGLDFKAPKQTDIKQWQKVQVLYAHGYAYHSCGCGGSGPRPATLREVEPFLAEQERLKIEQRRQRTIQQRANELRLKRGKSAKFRLAKRSAERDALD